MNQKQIDRSLTQDEMAYERTEMSNERTEMALERTALANSQTLLAYVRTAIGLLAAGIGMFEFVNNQMIITMGVIIMLLAPAVVGIGVVHYFMVWRNLKKRRQYWWLLDKSIELKGGKR